MNSATTTEATTWAALVGGLVYAALAFGWRSYRQWRTTGDHGFRGFSAPFGSLAWWAARLFTVCVLACLAAPVLRLAGVDDPTPPALPAVRWIGVVVALAGAGATLLTQTAMGASWRIGVQGSERTRLVTDGPFRHCRNPIFAAMVVTVAGLVLMAPTWTGLLGLLALGVAVHLQVRRVEEPYLRALHGRDYERYAARTGRYLPRLGRAQPDHVTDTGSGFAGPGS